MRHHHSIKIKRGEVYRVPRARKPAAYIKIIGIRRGRQPKVSYRRVTRTGGRRSGEPTVIGFLQFRDGAWRLPPTWEVQ